MAETERRLRLASLVDAARLSLRPAHEAELARAAWISQRPADTRAHAGDGPTTRSDDFSFAFALQAGVAVVLALLSGSEARVQADALRRLRAVCRAAPTASVSKTVDSLMELCAVLCVPPLSDQPLSASVAAELARARCTPAAWLRFVTGEYDMTPAVATDVAAAVTRAATSMEARVVLRVPGVSTPVKVTLSSAAAPLVPVLRAHAVSHGVRGRPRFATASTRGAPCFPDSAGAVDVPDLWPGGEVFVHDEEDVSVPAEPLLPPPPRGSRAAAERLARWCALPPTVDAEAMSAVEALLEAAAVPRDGSAPASNRAAVLHLLRHAKAALAGAPPAAAPALAVGCRVRLAPGWEAAGDAAHGPLAPSHFGTVVALAPTRAHVRGPPPAERTWWYDLVAVTAAPFPPAPPGQREADAAAPLAARLATMVVDASADDDVAAAAGAALAGAPQGLVPAPAAAAAAGAALRRLGAARDALLLGARGAPSPGGARTLGGCSEACRARAWLSLASSLSWGFGACSASREASLAAWAVAIEHAASLVTPQPDLELQGLVEHAASVALRAIVASTAAAGGGSLGGDVDGAAAWVRALADTASRCAIAKPGLPAANYARNCAAAAGAAAASLAVLSSGAAASAALVDHMLRCACRASAPVQTSLAAAAAATAAALLQAAVFTEGGGAEGEAAAWAAAAALDPPAHDGGPDAEPAHAVTPPPAAVVEACVAAALRRSPAACRQAAADASVAGAHRAAAAALLCAAAAPPDASAHEAAGVMEAVAAALSGVMEQCLAPQLATAIQEETEPTAPGAARAAAVAAFHARCAALARVATAAARLELAALPPNASLDASPEGRIDLLVVSPEMSPAASPAARARLAAAARLLRLPIARAANEADAAMAAAAALVFSHASAAAARRAAASACRALAACVDAAPLLVAAAVCAGVACVPAAAGLRCAARCGPGSPLAASVACLAESLVRRAWGGTEGGAGTGASLDTGFSPAAAALVVLLPMLPRLPATARVHDALAAAMDAAAQLQPPQQPPNDGAAEMARLVRLALQLEEEDGEAEDTEAKDACPHGGSPPPPGRLACAAAHLILRSVFHPSPSATPPSPCDAPLLAALLASRAASVATANPPMRAVLEAAAAGRSGAAPAARVLCARLLALHGPAAAPALRRIVWAVSPDARPWGAWFFAGDLAHDAAPAARGFAGATVAIPAAVAAAAVPTGSGSELARVYTVKQQRWLLFLRHASRCTAAEGTCAYTTHCPVARRLWDHLLTCDDPACTHLRCVPSRELLKHHQRCRDAGCPVCVPVRGAPDRFGAAPSEDELNLGCERGEGDVAVRRVALRALLCDGGAQPDALRALAAASSGSAEAGGCDDGGTPPAADAFVALLTLGGLSDSVVNLATPALLSPSTAAHESLLRALARALAAAPHAPQDSGLPQAVARARLVQAAWACCGRISFAHALARSGDTLAALVGIAEAADGARGAHSAVPPQPRGAAPPAPARRSLALMAEGDDSADAAAESLENQLASKYARAALLRLLRAAPPRDIDSGGGGGGGGGAWGVPLAVRAILAAATPDTLYLGGRARRRLDAAAASLLGGDDAAAPALARALEAVLRGAHSNTTLRVGHAGRDSLALGGWLARALLRRPRAAEETGADPVLEAARREAASLLWAALPPAGGPRNLAPAMEAAAVRLFADLAAGDDAVTAGVAPLLFRATAARLQREARAWEAAGYGAAADGEAWAPPRVRYQAGAPAAPGGTSGETAHEADEAADRAVPATPAAPGEEDNDSDGGGDGAATKLQPPPHAPSRRLSALLHACAATRGAARAAGLASLDASVISRGSSGSSGDSSDDSSEQDSPPSDASALAAFCEAADVLRALASPGAPLPRAFAATLECFGPVALAAAAAAAPRLARLDAHHPHELALVPWDAECTCDVCESDIPPGVLRWRCEACDFDACSGHAPPPRPAAAVAREDAAADAGAADDPSPWPLALDAELLRVAEGLLPPGQPLSYARPSDVFRQDARPAAFAAAFASARSITHASSAAAAAEAAEAAAADAAPGLGDRPVGCLRSRLRLLQCVSHALAARPAPQGASFPLLALFQGGSDDEAEPPAGAEEAAGAEGEEGDSGTSDASGSDDDDGGGGGGAPTAAPASPRALLRASAPRLLPTARALASRRALAASRSRSLGAEYPPRVALDRGSALSAREAGAAGDAGLTLFGQLQRQLGVRGSGAFDRRGAGDRPEAVLWTASLAGERALDGGGPFRETLTAAVEELSALCCALRETRTSLTSSLLFPC